MSSTTTWDSYLSPLWTPWHSASGSVRMAPWASQNARGRGCDLLVGPPRLRFLLRPEQGLYQGRCPVSPTAQKAVTALAEENAQNQPPACSNQVPVQNLRALSGHDAIIGPLVMDVSDILAGPCDHG